MADVKGTMSLDTSGVTAGVNKAKGSVDGLLGGLQGKIIGAFSIGAVVRFGAAVMSAADAMRDMADVTGLTIGQLQVLQNTAIANGSDLSTLQGVIAKITNSLAEAKAGTDTQIETWAKLGYTWDQVKALSPQDAILAISQALKVAQIGSAEYAAIIDIIGAKSSRASAALIAYGDAIASGDSGGAFRAQADAVDAVAEATDKLALGWVSLKNLGIQILGTWLKIATLVPNAISKMRGGDMNGIPDAQDEITLAKRMPQPEPESDRARLQREALAEFAKTQERKAEFGAPIDATPLTQKEQAEYSRKLMKELEDKAKREKDIAELSAKFTQDKIDIEQKTSVTAIKGDQLARIGGSVGGSVNPALTVAQRQLEVERQILKATQDNKRAIEKISAGGYS